jgi:hypothetical protein
VGCDPRSSTEIGVGADAAAAFLTEQVVYCGDSADALGGVVEGPRGGARRAAEQEEVGDGLQAVLDPMVALCQQGVLQLGAGVGVGASGGLTSRQAAEDDRQQRRGREERDAHRHFARGERRGSEGHHGEVGE